MKFPTHQCEYFFNPLLPYCDFIKIIYDNCNYGDDNADEMNNKNDNDDNNYNNDNSNNNDSFILIATKRVLDGNSVYRGVS